VAGSALEKRKSTAPSGHTVSPADEPSAEWGWHGEFRFGTPAAGVVVGLGTLAMLIGNHSGWTENLWLIFTGLAILGGVAWMIHKRRTSWRR
jgi:LPXTG-motif cell wall-anchored protein